MSDSGSKKNSKAIFPTGGKLSGVKTRTVDVDDTGATLDLKALNFPDSTGARHFYFANVGASAVYIAGDSDHGDINTADETTYNILLDAQGGDVPQLSYDFEADTISYKAASGQTTTLRIYVG